MKLLKKIGIAILVLLVLFVVAIFLVPQTFQVSVSENIDSKPSTLFNIVSDITLEKDWNPWQQQDTTMKSTYGEITKGVGATYSWDSKTMGSGSAEHIESIKNQKIVSKLDFGSMGEGVANYIFEKDGAGTKMTWTLDSKTRRPKNLMNILIRGEVKRSYRIGMENLAKLAKKREQQGMYRGYQIREDLLTDKYYVTRRDVVKMEDVPKFFAQSLGPLFKMLQQGGVEMDGPQTGLVYNHDPAKNELDIAAALPVSQQVNIKGAESQSFTTRRALVVDYYGDPAGTTIVHAAIDEYMADRDLHFDWPVVEEYVTDPADEPNQEKWLTRVIYYLSE